MLSNPNGANVHAELQAGTKFWSTGGLYSRITTSDPVKAGA